LTEQVEIFPVNGLNAKVAAPPSKAHTLRALFMAALTNGKTILLNPLLAEDQIYAINALKAFGVEIELVEGNAIVHGKGADLTLPSEEIFVGNSGVTARFITTFASLAPEGQIIVSGDKRMQSGRPIQDLLDALAPLGIKARSMKGNGCLPIEVEGNSFQGGKTKLSGKISSQYFSSILISAPHAKEKVEIETVGELRSKPYIDITIDLMKEFGVTAINNEYKNFTVKAGQSYVPKEYKVEGDYSNAAYFFAAAAITQGKVEVTNLNPTSAQGDKFFVECLQKMGCSVENKENSIVVQGKALNGITVDMSDYPDIVPPLAVVAAFAEGTTIISNIEHLRYKECDRLEATATELKKLGAEVETTRDSLKVTGNAFALKGAEIETYNDHRMAMSFAIAGLKVSGIKVNDPACVKKSFPNFFDKLKELGE
tara:strand:- start:1848 stop:3128 length:1281 start_codon:yes stop_codon:yes gene_type:complete